MRTTVGRIFTSQLVMLWVTVFIIGSYFLFSFNRKILHEEGITPHSVIKALRIPRLKLGIDLQGGTYFILSVEVEKALEHRLVRESKDLDQLFEKKKFSAIPKKKEIKGFTLTMDFEEEEQAKIAQNFIAKENTALVVERNGTTLHAKLSPVEAQRLRSGSVEQAVNVLNNRLNNFGVAGLIVQRHGDRQIVVQLPGVDDPERVKAVITKTAHLEFKIVEKASGRKDVILDDFDGELPSDKSLVPGKTTDTDEDTHQWYLVPSSADLTGDHIIDARVGHDEYGRIEVGFNLDSSGAHLFKELTGNNIGRRLGIVIDNVMYSAPTIQSEIGGTGRITNIGGLEEAKDLALVLRSGSLLAPIKFEQESRIGASLGQDSIDQGIKSCLVGLLLLLIFSILYYKLAGFFAILSLIYNLFLILLFLSYFEATLTLPGIAGMVLTIGMAIDASILIFERIKEGLKEGIPFKKAVNDGFNGAMSVILDSNITTLLTGIVLFKFGGPVIKAFAVTLIVGIIATVIAGVYFLRSIFDFTLDVLSKKSVRL